MTDPVVDREIQAMLAVDPSPAFLPRLRARIADEPRPAPWWMSWRLAAVMSAAALIVVAARMTAPRQGPQATALLASRPLSNALAMAASVDGRAISIGVAPPHAGTDDDRGGRAALGLAENAPETRAPDPEVLLDPRESAALRALILGVRSGAVDLEPVLRASIVSTTEPSPVGDIAIPPITIDPLAEGARP